MISLFVAGLAVASHAAWTQSQTAPTPPAAQTIKLTRTYKQDESTNYLVKVDMTGIAEMRLVSTVSTKVLKTLDDGKAELEWRAKIEPLASGPEMPDVPNAKMVFDAHFMPSSINVQGDEWLYLIVAMCGYVPAAEVAVGANFPVNWQASDKGFDLKGQGTLKEIKEVDGVKVAILQTDLTGTPAGDTPGKLKIASHVDAATGRLIKAEGSVEIESGPAIKFTISPAK
jgi:hypothetical protein